MSHPVEESLWKGLWTCGKDRQIDNFDDDDYICIYNRRYFVTIYICICYPAIYVCYTKAVGVETYENVFFLCFSDRASQHNLSKNQLDAQYLLFRDTFITFITSLYMFRAVTCSSSGG
jgi:hypothetical protein